MGMWRLHNLSKSYQQLPSDIFGIEENWLAWDFNHAVNTFGGHIEAELDKIKGSSAFKTEIKRRARLHELLGLPTFTYVPE
jgi:hypothetical protein